MVSNKIKLLEKRKSLFLSAFYFPPFCFIFMHEMASRSHSNVRTILPDSLKSVFCSLIFGIENFPRCKLGASLLEMLATGFKIHLPGYRMITRSDATDFDIVSWFSISVSHSALITSGVLMQGAD